MQNKLFNTLLAIVVATVITSLGAYIYNLVQSPTQELVLVKFLLSSTVIAVMALMIDIGRRWFVSSKVVNGTNDILLDIIGASVVMNASASLQVDNDLRELEDYYKEHILGQANSDDLIVEQLREQIVKRVKKYKTLKFRTAVVTEHVPQVRGVAP